MTLIDQLKRDEGLRLNVYRDTEGLLTIGYGHCLDRKGISKTVAEEMLKDDIADATLITRVRFPWVMTLSEPRQAAFVNLVFNLGGVGLAQFKKFLAAAQAGDWEKARIELLDSKYATQVGDRARRIGEQLVSDTWV
jgi:lysozyme